MKKVKITVVVDSNVHQSFKKFCKENGLVMGKRMEELMRADIEHRLIKIPKVKI